MATNQPPSYKKPVNINEIFGQRLSELRRERGYTQLQFGMIAGIERAYVSDLENGKKSPTLGVIYGIALALSMTISQLTKGLEA